MKLSLKTIFACVIVLAGTSLVLSSCHKERTDSPLVKLIEKLNQDLGTQVDNNPMFLAGASADYDLPTGAVSVSVEFADSIVNVEQLSEALVQFYTAMQLKANPGKDLDTFLNTMSSEEGSFNLTLSDVYGHSRTYVIPAARMKQLFTMKPGQLNFTEVKENVVEIFASAAPAYREMAKASDCTFAIETGFATYTLTFPSEAAYSNLNQGSLKGRYLHILQPKYENMEEFRAPIEEMLRLLQIDGYRFVYAPEKDSSKDLRVAIPWRNI